MPGRPRSLAGRSSPLPARPVRIGVARFSSARLRRREGLGLQIHLHELRDVEVPRKLGACRTLSPYSGSHRRRCRRAVPGRSGHRPPISTGSAAATANAATAMRCLIESPSGSRRSHLSALDRKSRRAAPAEPHPRSGSNGRDGFLLCFYLAELRPVIYSKQPSPGTDEGGAHALQPRAPHPYRWPVSPMAAAIPLSAQTAPSSQPRQERLLRPAKRTSTHGGSFDAFIFGDSKTTPAED